MTFNSESDCLEFSDGTEALTYFLGKLIKLRDSAKVKSKNPVNQDTYKKQIYELTHKFFAITDPKKVIFDLKEYKTHGWFLISEILSEMLGKNPPVYANYRDDIFSGSYSVQADGRARYLYGERFLENNSILKTFELLKKNPTSKGAVIQIFQHYDSGEGVTDRPCTTQYQFDQRDGKVNMFVSMRSWDWGPTGGVKYDLGLSSFILQSIASWLGAEPGKLFFYVKSLHVYEKDIEAMKKVNTALNYPRPGKLSSLEFEVDNGMEIGKFYDDTRKLLEIETLSRNKMGNKAQELLQTLNYKIFRDFARVYLLKNNCSNMLEIDEIQNALETDSIKSWYIPKKND